MTRIIAGLAEIADRYDVLLVDLWGCYHDGLRPWPAAVAACHAARARGQKVVLLTNAPRPAASVEGFLAKIGAPADSWDAVVSSGGACQAALESGRYGSRIHYLGPERDLHMLTDLGLEPATEAEAEAILCTGLEDDTRETPADYAPRLARLAARGLPMLCANPDIQVDRGAERLWCAGALARDYAAMGGEVTFFGKPHAPIYARAMEVAAGLLGHDPDPARVLAIGDGLGTDVKGGIEAGLDMLFVTGGLSADRLGPDIDNPCPEKLAALLAEQALAPAWAIGRLR